MEKNILDKATDKLMDTLMRTDKKIKNDNYYPYGQVPATREEKEEQFQNLDITQLSEMVEKYGRESVNEYLRKHMEVK